MPTGTLWALCSSSASSLSSPPKPKPPPQGNPPHFPPNNREARPHVGPPLKSRAPSPHTVISNGAGRLSLPLSLPRKGRLVHIGISLLYKSTGRRGPGRLRSVPVVSCNESDSG